MIDRFCLSSPFSFSLNIPRPLEKPWLSGDSQHPNALKRIHDLEKEKPHELSSDSAQDAPAANPLIVEHMNNLTMKEGERGTFKCKYSPTNDPTLEAGINVKLSRYSETSNSTSCVYVFVFQFGN